MQADILVHAPGRINIIGEHTDYNGGFVLPAAIDKGIHLRIRKNNDPHHCKIYSLDFNKGFAFRLDQIKPSIELWHNYFLGILQELNKLGHNIQGFDCELQSDLPIGSGMSSSAALECSFIGALNELFDLGLDRMEMVLICQCSNHHFIGVKSGIMDQFASIMGRKDHVVKLDCRDYSYEYFPLQLDEYQLVLLNTNVTHSLASSEYNTRREECEEGVRLLQDTFPEISLLRDVNIQMLNSQRAHLPEHIFRRCKHVILESQRVEEATSALLRQDFHKLGQLMYASHHSLQYDYKVSCPELDFLVEHSRPYKGVLGSRMMGGGFGGCTINLVKKESHSSFVADLSLAYAKRFGKELSVYEVIVSDGLKVWQQAKV